VGRLNPTEHGMLLTFGSGLEESFAPTKKVTPTLFLCCP
jgi:hypothetical protein